MITPAVAEKFIRVVVTAVVRLRDRDEKREKESSNGLNAI
jgi:hypothetical protein